MSASPPVSGLARGLVTVAPTENPLESETSAPPPPKAPSTNTSLAVWTPPRPPSAWQRMTWSLFGRPEPGLDGRYDHIVIDAGLVTVPSDQRLASLVLGLAKNGELSVRNLVASLASDATGGIKPKAVDAVRKNIRIAAEKLEQRSPGAKLADAARSRLEVLRRELDKLDALRAQPAHLRQRAESGVSALFATFDGQNVELQTLLTGAANALGAEHDKLEVLRAGLTSLVARRDAMQPSLEDQLTELRALDEQRKAEATEAARAQESRVAVITALSQDERNRYSERLERATKMGTRFYTPTGTSVPARDVLAHLAWHGVQVALGGPSTWASQLGSLLPSRKEGPRQAIHDLTGLENLLKRLGLGR